MVESMIDAATDRPAARCVGRRSELQTAEVTFGARPRRKICFTFPTVPPLLSPYSARAHGHGTQQDARQGLGHTQHRPPTSTAHTHTTHTPRLSQAE